MIPIVKILEDIFSKHKPHIRKMTPKEFSRHMMFIIIIFYLIHLLTTSWDLTVSSQEEKSTMLGISVLGYCIGNFYNGMFK